MDESKNYSVMSDEEVLRDLAEQIEKLRVAHQIKETELEKASGISRKTLYNFRQGTTGFSLRNFIRLLRALGEMERLQGMFPAADSWSPRSGGTPEYPKRVRDSKNAAEKQFQWGDEK